MPPLVSKPQSQAGGDDCRPNVSQQMMVQWLHAAGAPESVGGPLHFEALTKLAEVESYSFESFLMCCILALQSDGVSLPAKRAAVMLWKNAVNGGARPVRGYHKFLRWRSLSDSTRNSAHEAALRSLNLDGLEGLHRVAPLLVASMASIDLPLRRWQELLPTLKSLLDSGSDLKAGTVMETLTVMGEEWQYLPQEISDSSLVELSSSILREFVVPVLTSSRITLRADAVRAVQALLPFAIPHPEQGIPAHILRCQHLLLESTKGATPDYCQEVFACFGNCIPEFYRLNDLNPLFELVLKVLNESGGEDFFELINEAAQVLSAVAEHELWLLEPAQAEHKKLCFHNACWTIKDHLLSPLLSILVQCCRMPGDDEDATLILESVCDCIEALAKVLGDSIVPPIVQFAEQGCSSRESCDRRAGLLAFAAVQEGPAEVALGQLVSASLPTLLASLGGAKPSAGSCSSCWAGGGGGGGPEGGGGGPSRRLDEAKAAARALGRALAWHPAAIPDEAQASLFALCMERLQENSMMCMVEELCHCLDGLLDQQAGALQPDDFQAVVNVLMQTWAAAKEETARVTVLNSFSELIGRANSNCVPLMEPALTQILASAESTVRSGNRCPESALCALRAMTLRLGEAVAPYAQRLLRLYISEAEIGVAVTSASRTVGSEEEALRAAGTLLLAAGKHFPEGFGLLWPVLSAGLGHTDEPVLALAAILATREVVTALGSALQEQAPAILEALYYMLQQREGLHPMLRAPAIRCIGEVCKVLGPTAPNLEAVLRLLEGEANSAGRKCLNQQSSNQSATPSPPRRRCKSSPSSARRAENTAKESTEAQVLEAVLLAYESIVTGSLGASSGNSNSSNFATLPESLRYAAPALINFACSYGTAAGVSPTAKRAAVRLVGTLAAHLPSEVASYAQKDASVKACIESLRLYGSASPNKLIRQCAGALTDVVSL